MSAAVAIETGALPPRMLKIIDLSSVQGLPDWQAVVDDGIVGAYLKCTDGTKGKDPSYLYNYKNASMRGVACGAYSFGQPAPAPGLSIEQDALAEVRHFFETSGGLGSSKGEMPPVLDLEKTGGLTMDAVAKWARVWIEEAEQLWGVVPVIYTGLPMQAALRLIPTATRCPLWVAAYPQYVVGQDKRGRDLYSKAITWEQAATKSPPRIEPWAANGWTLWQFSGGMDNPSQLMPGNNVKGIKTWVDCNRFNGGEREWEAFARLV